MFVSIRRKGRKKFVSQNEKLYSLYNTKEIVIFLIKMMRRKKKISTQKMKREYDYEMDALTYFLPSFYKVNVFFNF